LTIDCRLSTIDWLISLQDFVNTGALLKGHFRLSSGLHSDTYLQCARLLMWPERAEEAGRELAAKLSEFAPGLVVSPALGGVVIGHEVARALRTRYLFTERQDGVFALRRGFRVEEGERAVIVEDVFTTGRSTREVIDTIRSAGGQVVAAGSIVNRGLPSGALPVPSRSLLDLQVPAWPSERCPLCRDRAPLDTPGSRHGADGT
jgi:orotate phosphoribosyltransferase